MVRKSIMLLAGEPSGDALGAELVPILREKLTGFAAVPTTDSQPLETSLEPKFFGAGGPKMAAAGVDLTVEMTRHSVVGLWEVLRNYRKFRALFQHLMQRALERQPDAIISIDFSGFNLRFAHAIQQRVRSMQGTFGNWRPRFIQYVSPQVWASRPQRAQRLAADFDLLLAILPFEKDWYASHAPNLRVEFVGHPIVDRHKSHGAAPFNAVPNRTNANPDSAKPAPSNLLLLPGSRAGELTRHLPVMLGALRKIRSGYPPLRCHMALPDPELVQLARTFQLPPEVQVSTGQLAPLLRAADLAIAATGTVTLECAFFGVPTVALYRTSPATYAIGKRLVRLKFIAMPNILAGEEIFPEFIQDAATAENLAQAALSLLQDVDRRNRIRVKLAKVIESLGPPGASERAARAIVNLLRARRASPL